MICYDKFGQATKEFLDYSTYLLGMAKIKDMAQGAVGKAIEDDVCPRAILEQMKLALEIGATLAMQKARVDSHKLGG